MRRWGAILSYSSALLLSVLLLRAATVGVKRDFSAPKPTLTIAQITDAHIFDDGWKAKGSDPYQYAMDDRTALHWAVDTINSRADSTGVDLVVFTGDFGLQNVFFADPACSKVPFKSEPGLPPFSSDMAAAELALEFDRLKVPDVYVVAGNNDIIDEQVIDYPRFECFISQLQSALTKLSGRVHVQILRPDRAVAVGSFRLAGMNTASFKAAKNYSSACAAGTTLSGLTMSCPQPQVQALTSLVNTSTAAPLLLFTHVPDLFDPFKKSPSWGIDSAAQDAWLQMAANPQLAGIFAGHFHSNEHAYYGTNIGTKILFVDARDGQKTWLAPPLAGKNQRDGNGQARGFLWLSVGLTGGKSMVDVTPEWYPGAGPAQNNGAHHMSQQCFFLLIVLVILIAGCFGGLLNYLLNKSAKHEPPDPDEPSFGANLFLGIGAAFLVPLFLHVIGSDLVTAMHHGENGQPDYSKVLVFAGFCLVASMSARAFIKSVSDRILKKAEKAEEDAAEAKRQAREANNRIASLEVRTGMAPTPPNTAPSDDEPQQKREPPFHL